MNDKKKLLAIGGLGLVLLGVGAFQFTSFLFKPEVKVTVKETESSEPKRDPAQEERDRLMAMLPGPLPVRDPFLPKIVADQANANVPEAPTAPPAGSTAQRTSPPAGQSRPQNISIPPLDPLMNPLGALGGSPGGELPPMNLSPSAPMRSPEEFAYRLRGAVVGQRPVAIFEDDAGNQRMIPVGGSIDGQSKVVAIEEGRVTVRHRGRTLNLTLQGASID